MHWNTFQWLGWSWFMFVPSGWSFLRFNKMHRWWQYCQPSWTLWGAKLKVLNERRTIKGGPGSTLSTQNPNKYFFFNFYPAGINCRRNKMIVALIVLHSTLFANKSKIAGGKGVLGTYHFFHQHLPGTLRYAKSMGESIKTMNELYDQLTKLQGEAYTCKEGSPESCPENPKS